MRIILHHITLDLLHNRLGVLDEVGMIQSLICCDALSRIIFQHSRQKFVGPVKLKIRVVHVTSNMVVQLIFVARQDERSPSKDRNGSYFPLNVWR